MERLNRTQNLVIGMMIGAFVIPFTAAFVFKLAGVPLCAFCGCGELSQ